MSFRKWAAVFTVAAAGWGPRAAVAADGIWINLAGTNLQWNNPGYWAGSVAAGGAGSIAYLTNNITNNVGIDLQYSNVLGGVYLGDDVGTSTFTITNSTVALTLTNSSGHVRIVKERGGADLIGTRIILGLNLLATNNSGQNLTFSNVITQSGSRSITYDSTGGVLMGRFVVSGSNLYAGGTSIRAARLAVQHSLGAGSGAVTVTNGGQLYLGAGIAIANAVTLSGTGWPETGHMNLGAIRFENNAAVSGPVTLAGNARVSAYADKLGYLVGGIAGPYTLEIGEEGGGTPGTITLLGNNSYGNTVISNLAVLVVGTNTAAGTLGTGPVQNDGDLRIRRSNAYVLSNLIGGAGALTINGGGTITLTQPNSYAGNTTNLAGTLALGVDNAVGTGLLDLRGGAVRSADAAAKTVTNAANISIGPVLGDASTGPLVFSGSVNNGGGAKMLTVSNAWTAFTGPLTGSGPLGKQGPGDLHLSNTVNTLSYTGLVGRTALGPAGQFVNVAGTVTVGAAGTLDVSAWDGAGGYVFETGQVLRGAGAVLGRTVVKGTASPGLPAGTLTFSNGLDLVDARLPYELSASAATGTNDLIEVGGDLSLSGTTYVSVLPIEGTLDTATPYRLMNYAGALLGGTLALDPATPIRSTYALAISTATPQQVNLLVSGAGGDLVWSGGTGGNWNVNQDFAWALDTDVFYQGDAVTFDDGGIAAGRSVVTLAGTLYPSSVLVNASGDYGFGGAGAIAGSRVALTKENAGRLTISNRNTYGGGTYVNGGTLALGAGGTAGAVVGDLTVRNGATLHSLVNDSVGYVAGTKVNMLTIQTGSLIQAANVNVSLWGVTVNLQQAFLSPTGGSASRIDFGYDGAAGSPPTFLNILPDDQPTVLRSTASVGVSTNGSFSLRQALLTNYVADGGATTDLWVDAKVSGNNNTWVKTGPGTVVFSGPDGTDNNSFKLQVDEGLAILAKASTATNHAVGFGGQGLFIHGGTVQLAGTGDDQIFSQIDTVFNALGAAPGVLDLNGRSEGFDALLGTGVVRNAAAATLGTLTVGQNNEGGFRWEGTLEDGGGTLALVKAGTGRLAFGGTNTHSGPTVISAGVLRVGHWGNVGTLGGGDVTNNATLELARGDYGVLDVSNRIFGTGALTVIGTYTNGQPSLVTVSGDNAFLGNVNITTGALRIAQSTSLGTGSKTVQISNGTAGSPSLRLDPGEAGAIDLGTNIAFNSSWVNGVLFNLSGTNLVRGNWTLIGGGGDTTIVSSNGFLTLAGVLQPNQTGRGLRLGGPADGAVSGTITEPSAPSNLVVRKFGPGTWTLGGTNTYTGQTLVDEGRLALGLTGSISNSTVITVSNAAVLDVSGTASTFGVPAAQALAGEGTVTGSVVVSGGLQPGKAGLAGTLTFTDDLTLDSAAWQAHLSGPTDTGATNDLVAVGGSPTLSGSSQLTVVSLTNRLPGGAYVLMTNALPRIGGAAEVVVVNAAQYRGVAIDDTDPLSLKLNVAGATNLEWSGGSVSSVWDVGTTYAWNANLEAFYRGDGVLFSDVGGASNQVVLTGALTPDAVLVNSASNYVFGGTGKMSGSAGLDKQGPGSLAISNANDYAGVTTIGGGTVLVANAAALGSGAGATVVAGGVLDVNNRDLRSEPVILAGGTLWNGGSSAGLDAIRQLTVVSNSAVGSWTGRFGAAATGAGPTPFVAVSNDVTLALDTGNFEFRSGMRVTNHGVIAVGPGGYLRMHSNVRSEGGTGVYTVAAGGTIEYGSHGTQTVNSNGVILAGGTLGAINSSGGNPMQAGFLSLPGTGGVVNVTSNLYVTGPLLGPGTLAKIGALELIFSNDMAGFTGALAINTGAVRLVQTQALALVSPVTNSGPGTTGSLISDVAGGLTVTGQVHLSASLRLSQGVPYSSLTVAPGATIAASSFWIGEQSGRAADVGQSGGDISVASFRLGHWPAETSRYVMAAGSLQVTGIPAGGVNLSGGTEQAGVLYLGVDGMAIFTQKAGAASAYAIVLNNRADTPGPQEFTQEGGTFTLGPGGLLVGGTNLNLNYQINLGGGTLASSANWTSAMFMALTGANGPETFDTAGNAITLHGRLSGPGGLVKAGLGTLALFTNETYQGNTEVSAGTLALVNLGDLDASPVIHVGSNALLDVSAIGGGVFGLASNQTLSGDGTVTGNVLSAAGATVAPGSSPGILTVQGDYTEQAGATLAVEVKGAAAGSGYDRLAVWGAASLAATLTLDAGAYVGAPAVPHTILTASNVVGTFANAPTNGSPLVAGGNTFLVSYTPTSVVLTAQGGDPDLDGDGLPASLDPNDGNPNTDGGAMGDYNEWLAFGNATSAYEAFFLAHELRGSNAAVLVWPAISNRHYRIFSTTNILSGYGAWTNLVADLPPNSDGRYTNPVGPRVEHYRIDVRLNP